jgi:hypothetical protein
MLVLLRPREPVNPAWGLTKVGQSVAPVNAPQCLNSQVLLESSNGVTLESRVTLSLG